MQRDLCRRLKVRGIDRDPATVLPSWDELQQSLPPGAWLRKLAYEETRSTLEGIGGSFLADVEQWPAAGKSAAGSFFPCQLSHGTVVSWQLERCATALEHLSANGWHVLPATSQDYRCELTDFLATLSSNVLKDLSGNGLSLLSFSAFLMYVFCRTKPVVVLCPSSDVGSHVQRAMSSAAEDEDPGDERGAIVHLPSWGESGVQLNIQKNLMISGWSCHVFPRDVYVETCLVDCWH